MHKLCTKLCTRYILLSCSLCCFQHICQNESGYHSANAENECGATSELLTTVIVRSGRDRLTIKNVSGGSLVWTIKELWTSLQRECFDN